MNTGIVSYGRCYNKADDTYPVKRTALFSVFLFKIIMEYLNEAGRKQRPVFYRCQCGRNHCFIFYIQPGIPDPTKVQANVI